ncbi:granule associated Rac and RHOG effector protein 1-like isoform X4 [Pezoporus flaviventris]|uniref:granule associated Rac and RHOG effector protein 1-like isoform X4 n=1 Tax=Pezoporus flaviventris TaxID=889875 RepID=UPI002AB1165F|nr:granule associated Rac and RHOG effector protein 1-like isoform X4 [Pezoporus flaviventris]
MYCCSTQESKMDYKRRFLLVGSKQKVQQQQQYQMPELGRTLSAPLASTSPASPLVSSAAAGSCSHTVSHMTPIADIQQGISKYLDALNVFCHTSTFLTDLFSSVFKNSQYSKAAMKLKDVQEHVMEAASQLTATIKPEIAKMLMELSAGAANFKDQKEFSLQDIEVLGRCFLTVMQVHFQFLSQAVQKVQPVAHSCFAEAVAQEKKNVSGARTSSLSPTNELEDAIRSWRGAAEATSQLRERGCDGCLAGIEVQQLFCSQSVAVPEHQLKLLNMKIDSALQAYKVALESLGHCEYALKAGFHLNPKAIEASLQGCCSEAEAQQTGRRQTTPQPIQSELPTVPVQIGSHFLKGISFNESAAENLKLKMHTMLQLIKEAGCHNGLTPWDDSPVTEVLNQVCPSTWRGACKTAVQLLFGQAGLLPVPLLSSTACETEKSIIGVVVDTAQIENKETYAPQISLEGSRIVVQVPSTWEQALPCIQIQLQREILGFGNQVDTPSGNGSKSSGGLQKTFSKLTSRFTKKTSCTSTSNTGSYSIPSTPSKNVFISFNMEEKAKMLTNIDARLQSILNIGNFPRTADPLQSVQNTNNQLVNGCLVQRQDNFFKLDNSKDDKVMNLPTDQEMQDVIDFLSGFNMGKSQQTSPMVKRRNSASSTATEQKSGTVQQQPQSVSHAPLHPSQQGLSQQQQSQKQQQQMQYYQHLLQPIGPQQHVPAKWLTNSLQQPAQAVGAGLPHIHQWNNPGFSDLSSDLYSLGLVSSYMDNMMSEMLGQKPQGPRNNTWPNRDQTDGVFGMLGEILPFDTAVGSDPEFASYVAGVNQAMQQKRQAQHAHRPSNTHNNWPFLDDPHKTCPFPEHFTEGDVTNSWSGTQGDSASSSDEASSANGDSLFSMFSGPDLVAAVKQRRKHSSGEQVPSALPSPTLLSAADDRNEDKKTKTWPPKAPWQHPSSVMSTLPSQNTPLYPMSSPISQWSDTMQILQSPMWAAANDCAPAAGLSSNFAYVPKQSQQASQQKQMNKDFKTFPGKHECRPSYLHQY